MPELDVDGWECHVLDYGPGGLLGAQRDLVRRELGLARAGRGRARGAAQPPSPGWRRDARAVAGAAEQAFGTTADEQLLRRVLLRGYFDPAPSHEAAARELHLSRAAYFRRLRTASDRVAEWLALHP